MISAFKKRSINAMVGLNNVPTNLANNSGVYDYNIPLTAEVMVFFRNSQAILSDVNVRQALVEAIDKGSIINSLGYPVIPAKSPLLPFQIGYNADNLQLSTNVSAAEGLLNSDGWVLGKDGIRYKNGQPLQFQLVTQDSSEYDNVASQLSDQWRKVGVNVQVVPEGPTELQSSVASHSYDSLLYAISIGVDPDVFVYWDSSQINASPSLNLSEYDSSNADQSLESGRTVLDPALRAIKYLPFLQSWDNDSPALALYQPRFLYITRGQVFGFSPTMINVGTDRFNNVQNWMVNEVKVTNT
jgi:peptide/nickel transport system substrate-binding protein